MTSKKAAKSPAKVRSHKQQCYHEKLSGFDTHGPQTNETNKQSRTLLQRSLLQRGLSEGPDVAASNKRPREAIQQPPLISIHCVVGLSKHREQDGEGEALRPAREVRTAGLALGFCRVGHWSEASEFRVL